VCLRSSDSCPRLHPGFMSSEFLCLASTIRSGPNPSQSGLLASVSDVNPAEQTGAAGNGIEHSKIRTNMSFICSCRASSKTLKSPPAAQSQEVAVVTSTCAPVRTVKVIDALFVSFCSSSGGGRGSSATKQAVCRWTASVFDSAMGDLDFSPTSSWLYSLLPSSMVALPVTARRSRAHWGASDWGAGHLAVRVDDS
jgi:hypothetical protein